MSNKPVIAIDFDGTLTDYKGWRGESITDDALPGAVEFLRGLASKYTIVIFSARASSDRGKRAILDWIRRYNLRHIIFDVTNEKKYSFVYYIDDRAITFREPNDYNKISEALLGIGDHIKEESRVVG